MNRLAALFSALLLLLAACDGELSDGLPDAVPTGGSSCDTCHGFPPADPHPVSLGGMAMCYACHPDTVVANTGDLNLEAGFHRNDQVDFTEPACDACHGNPPSSTHGKDITSCAGCHGETVNADGTVNWAGGKHANGEPDATLGSESCGSCHGMPPAKDHPDNDDCAMCHGSVVDGDKNIIDTSLHMNGDVNMN